MSGFIALYGGIAFPGRITNRRGSGVLSCRRSPAILQIFHLKVNDFFERLSIFEDIGDAISRGHKLCLARNICPNFVESFGLRSVCARCRAPRKQVAQTFSWLQLVAN